MATAKTITPKAPTAAEKKLDARIEAIIKDKFDHYLDDLSFRIGQAYDVVGRAGNGASISGKVYAEDLNLPGRAFLTGYTVTPNSPVVGSFAWADLHVVYNGVDTLVTNGNSAMKYVWWSSITTPTVLQSNNTKPSLVNGEVLLFMNVSGTPQVMLSDTNASMPGVLRDGAVDATSILANAVTSAAIAENAVTTTQLNANAITSAKLADGAIIRATQITGKVIGAGAIVDNTITSGQIADNAITSGEINANAIISTKIADSAINRTGMLFGKVVATGVIQDNAITNGQLADNAVIGSSILANSVTSTKLADGAVIRETQLGNDVINTAQIKPNAVTTTELATGAVSATKLSILRHMLY